MHLSSKLLPGRVAFRWTMALAAAISASCIKDLSGPDQPAAPVAEVVISPRAVALPVGGTARLTVTLMDSAGNPLSDRAVTWASSTTDVATVSDNGLVTAVSAGSATITATSEGQSDTASVSVTVTAVPVASITVTPSSAGVHVDSSIQLAAMPKDAAGNALPDRPVTWSSGAPAIATVTSTGLVTGVAPGTAVITAATEGRSGSATITVTRPPPPSGGVVLVGAGDIAVCDGEGDEATARLLDDIPGTVFTTGDNAYPDGAPEDFANCYHPSWGRHKARTRPSPGNHDYGTSDAAGYFAYFGAAAGEPGKGYYSYDLGNWHVVSLNSNVDMDVGSPQEQWLRADLAATGKECVLAYWHDPRFSSGGHGSSTEVAPLYQALYDHHAEVVVVGHDHDYERFAPQNPNGILDAQRGIRQFVVGTGGASLDDPDPPIANSEVHYGGGHGVIKFTLRDGSYTWEFVSVTGQTFTDTGSGSCH